MNQTSFKIILIDTLEKHKDVYFEHFNFNATTLTVLKFKISAKTQTTVSTKSLTTPTKHKTTLKSPPTNVENIIERTTQDTSSLLFTLSPPITTYKQTKRIKTAPTTTIKLSTTTTPLPVILKTQKTNIFTPTNSTFTTTRNPSKTMILS